MLPGYLPGSASSFFMYRSTDRDANPRNAIYQQFTSLCGLFDSFRRGLIVDAITTSLALN